MNNTFAHVYGGSRAAHLFSTVVSKSKGGLQGGERVYSWFLALLFFEYDTVVGALGLLYTLEQGGERISSLSSFSLHKYSHMLASARLQFSIGRGGWE